MSLVFPVSASNHAGQAGKQPLRNLQKKQQKLSTIYQHAWLLKKRGDVNRIIEFLIFPNDYQKAFPAVKIDPDFNLSESLLRF